MPFVTTNSGEIKYLYKHGFDASLVNKNDAIEMVNKIEKTISNEELAKSLSMNARKKAETFNWVY